MADGGIRIDVGLNTSKAEKDLAKLRMQIAKLEAQLSSNQSQKSVLEDQIREIGAQADEATRKVRELKEEMKNSRGSERERIRDELGEALEEQRRLVSESNRLNDEYVKIKQSIEDGTASLEGMEEEAGELEGALEKAAPKEAFNSVMESAEHGIKGFMKTVLGIATAAKLFSVLKNSIVSSVQAFAEYDATTKGNIEELRQSLEQLKLSWGAAFAPIFNVVQPAINSLIQSLISAANAVARFIAIISGRGTYSKVVSSVSSYSSGMNAMASTAGKAAMTASTMASNMDDVSKASKSAAKNIGEAKRQLMAFDEINRLEDTSDSGGGGGGGGGGGEDDPWTVIQEEVDALDGGFLASLALTVKDVLFDWSDLNDEQIAEKLLAGLGAALGFGTAIALGLGPGGVILMTIGGLVISLVLGALIFDHDGRLDNTELLDMLLAITNAFVGAAIAFTLFPGAGIKGALIGASVAFTLTMLLKALDYKTDGALSKNGIFGALTSFLGGVLGMALGKMYLGAALGAAAGPVGSLIGIALGFVLTLVVQSIRWKAEARDSFYDSSFGQSVTELKEKLEDQIQINLDLTAHIDSITGEVDDETIAKLSAAQNIIEKIFTLDEKENKTSGEIGLIKQYIEELNSMGLPGVFVEFDEATGHVNGTKEALIQTTEALLHQYQVQAMGEAYIESLKAQMQAQEEYNSAVADGVQAVEQYETAVTALKEAEAELTEIKEKYNQDPLRWEEDYNNAERAVETAREGVKATKENAELAQEAIETAQDALDAAGGKVDEIEKKFEGLSEKGAEAGAGMTTGFTDATIEGTEAAAQASEDLGSETLARLRGILEEESPSKATHEIGLYATEGFKDGIQEGASEAVTAVEDLGTQVKDAFDNMSVDTVSVVQTMRDGIAEVFAGIVSDVAASLDELRGLMNFEWSLPRPRIPVIRANTKSVSYGDGQSVSIPEFFVDWYARGGVFSKPQLIGVGESGKEAVVPLERNTEWIRNVADSLLDRLTTAARLTSAMASTPMPALAGGGIAPPNALGSGSGGFGSDAFMDSLGQKMYSSFMQAFSDADFGSGVKEAVLNVNGREFCRATFTDSQAVAKEHGVSLIVR